MHHVLNLCIPGVALIIVFYDHLLTLHEELSTIWRTKKSANHLQKATFLLNRYFVEAVVGYTVYVFNGTASTLDDTVGDDYLSSISSDVLLRYRCHNYVWVFSLVGVGVTSMTQLYMILRVYSTWDKRRSTTVILVTMFVIFIAALTPNAILALIDVQSVVHYIPKFSACAVLGIPKYISAVMGVMLLFDLCLISLAVFNALERPYKTHGDVLDSLHNDGAKLFLVSPSLNDQPQLNLPLCNSRCKLRLIYLRFGRMTPIHQPSDCYSIICVVWTSTSVINSRVHMRVEGLKNLGNAFGE
ncbi:hypothetical protein C8R41DRAFT_766208 [Lentinula lateritia]|uniref:DUF6533 domain-containing protein n=1 Tax=Lentinula lateritia TaxID=40482 RepID=A0ABQ8VEJ9_9AGAR|nr:hypothetical protein C8R41DRAFT_766208 [Lentinula lateritia]